MIRTVSNGITSINIFHDRTNTNELSIEIRDVNGVGASYTVDQFEELKSMIDYIWGQNNLWQYRSENSENKFHPVCDGRLR